VLRAGTAFVLGLAPLALGFALQRRPPEIALSVPALELLERASVPTTALGVFAGDVGPALAIACAGGGALAWLVPDARRPVASLAAVVAAAVLAVLVHAAAGPDRYSATVLAGLLSAGVLGVVLLATLVLAIARARVPFAEASAAFVVVLELVLPVRSLDETTTRREGRYAPAADVWNDIAWGAAPPASVVLVPDRGTMRRVARSRATGAMRGDLVMVPSFDVQGRAGLHALAAEPKLAALYRDIALGLPPEELSLSQLGAQRPVLATFDPSWERALSRHLVPVGLVARFEPEPRGASDRKQALEAFAPARDRLVRATIAKRDTELAGATATLLRARAIGMAATGEREILERTLDDLRVFSREDPVDAKLVRRLLTTKGPIDVHDLSP
jgi:hypothetical protein